MTPATTFVAHDVPDLINTLPTLFGFRPEESLVAVATYGPRRRFGFRMRLDMPEAEHVDAAADLVVHHLRANDADGAIVVALTEHQDVARELVAAVERRLGDIQVVVGARADGRRYWTDEPGTSEAGVPYETSDHHLAIVNAVAAGQEILPDRQALVDRFRPVPEPRRSWMHHATTTVLAQLVRESRRTDDLLGDAVRDVRSLVERGVAGESLTDHELVRLWVLVSFVEVRDAAWHLMTRDNALDMLRVWTQVARSVVPPFEADVLALTAFAAWLVGDGAQAHVAADRAHRAAPAHRMTGILRGILQQGVSPDHWAAVRAADLGSP